jgi:hypothetical protein
MWRENNPHMVCHIIPLQLLFRGLTYMDVMFLLFHSMLFDEHCIIIVFVFVHLRLEMQWQVGDA